MSTNSLNLREEDVVRLTLEFLHNRDLHIAQLSLERETGVINGNYAEDLLYLRQLILDGQWDDVLEFVKPLKKLNAFDADKFKYIILKHKYIELLCIRSEGRAQNYVKEEVDDVVKVLSDLEKLSPSKDDYSNMCLLLTLPSITDHAEFKNWNPSNARVQCFRQVYPLVEHLPPFDKKSSGSVAKCSKNDRMMQLLIKGILYESCVKYCRAKAGSKDTQSNELNFSRLLVDSSDGESNLSLLSWLQSIPAETFSIPFGQRVLNVDIEKLERPSLQTSWTEHMFVTPIKPRTFPHLKMSFKRPRSATDAMTRSLRPLPDGASMHPDVMAQSAIDYGPSSSCFTGFHLGGSKGNKMMTNSVDRLFGNGIGDSLYHGTPELKTIVENYKPVDENSSPTMDKLKSHDSSVLSDGTLDSHNKCHVSSLKTTGNNAQEHNELYYTASIPSSNAIALAEDSLYEESIEVESPNSNAVSPQSYDMLRTDLYKKSQIQNEECDNRLRNRSAPHARAKQVGTPSGIPNKIPIPDDLRREALLRMNDNMTPDKAIQMNAQNRHVGHQDLPLTTASNVNVPDETNGSKSTFKAVTILEDVQAIRCAEFHPNGKHYAVGSNTKTLRICSYPRVTTKGNAPTAPSVLLKRTKHHKGSIYCLAWSPAGDLLATGSNDKTVKLMRYNSLACNLEGQEMELPMHDGTVRDVCFIEDTTNKTSLLVSGGAGDCKIYVTDCATGKLFQALSGHSGHISSLYNWGGATFVSGSQDKTVRFWDLRAGRCVNVITFGQAAPGENQSKGSAVASLAVEPTGRLLVSGHEDGSCVLYDVRGSRTLQCFQPHSSDLRSVRFSPGAYYLLTAGYDKKVLLTDLQGDLICPLPSVQVAHHQDKVISARWHTDEFSFLSTSADKTAVLWSIPAA